MKLSLSFLFALATMVWHSTPVHGQEQNSTSFLRGGTGDEDTLPLLDTPNPIDDDASHERRLGLTDWTMCTSSSQCNNGCCSGKYSGGVLKCTPLNSGFNPVANGCVGNSGGTAGGTCGGGNRGNGICPQAGLCCSKWGWCGTSAAHCDGASSGGGGGGSTGGGSVILSASGSGTFYYDVTGRSCSGPPYAENKGYPTCTSHDPRFWKTLEQYGTNNIVAINNRLLSTPEGRAKYCGKQVRVYRNGVEVSGGPFVVMDGCEACAHSSILDFSLSALDTITGGSACQQGNVPGISWSITDKQVIPFVP